VQRQLRRDDEQNVQPKRWWFTAASQQTAARAANAPRNTPAFASFNTAAPPTKHRFDHSSSPHKRAKPELMTLVASGTIRLPNNAAILAAADRNAVADINRTTCDNVIHYVCQPARVKT
jgi:hypothetical protein